MVTTRAFASSSGFAAADGTLWFATLRDFSRYDGIAWYSFDEQDSLPPGRLCQIAQDPSSAIWGGQHGLKRYRLTNGTPRSPAVVVQTDRAFEDLSALPHITAGRLVTLKCARL